MATSLPLFCVRENCRRTIQPEWSFCAFCGADNRPPEDQHPIKSCDHETVIEGPHCIRCGMDTTYDEQPLGLTRKQLGAIMMAIGIILLIVGPTLSRAGPGQALPRMGSTCIAFGLASLFVGLWKLTSRPGQDLL